VLNGTVPLRSRTCRSSHFGDDYGATTLMPGITGYIPRHGAAGGGSPYPKSSLTLARKILYTALLSPILGHFHGASGVDEGAVGGLDVLEEAAVYPEGHVAGRDAVPQSRPRAQPS